MKTLKLACIALSLLAAVGAFAQTSIAFTEALNGKKIPASLKPKDLPADFWAVKITISSENSLLDLYGGSFGLEFRARGGEENSEKQRSREALLQSTGVYWTKGDTVKIATSAELESQKLGNAAISQEYLIAYKLDIPIAALTGGSGASFDTWAMENPLELTLQLIRPDSIAKMTPVPTLTPQKMSNAVESFQRTLAEEVGVKPEAFATAVAAGAGSTSSRQTAALSNVKQLALGVLMYQSDYDDVFPPKPSTSNVQNVIRPYLKNDQLWKTGNPNHSRFLYNPALAGFSASDVDQPAEMPLIYEDIPWPDGRRAVAYTDGHARLVSGQDWNRIALLLRAKLKHTTSKTYTAPKPTKLVRKQ